MTYSIVARDAETGELGVAVQSHWFSVGSVVPWAQPGVGAVATQSLAEISYGPRALELIAAGGDASTALAQLLGEDEAAATRQVAVIDAGGGIATHTGALCIGFAGDVAGDQVSCQANLMRSAEVWPAMLTAYERAAGPLAGRLLAALDAGEAAGGDIRGRQSAALLVVPGAGAPWETSVSLRVEDHPDPLPELRRLVELGCAYTAASSADTLSGQGRHDEAAQLYRAAAARAPDSHELRFWAGLGLAQAGDVKAGAHEVRAAIAAQAGWREVLARLPPAVAPSAADVLAEITNEGD